MSVQSEIDRIKGNIAGTYEALEQKEVDLPEEKISANLPRTILDMPKPYTKFISPYGRVMQNTAIGTVSAYVSKVEAGSDKLILHLAVSGTATRTGNFTMSGTTEIRY